MSYTYSPGDGLAALDPTEPVGTDQVAVIDEAIRQIKAYLADATPGIAPITGAEVDAKIAAALGGTGVVPGKDLFKAIPAVDQDIVHPGAGTITTNVVLGTEVFDLDTNFATNIFTAPAAGYYFFSGTMQISIPTPASAAAWTFVASFIANGSGGSILLNQQHVAAGSAQRIFTGSGVMLLAANETVKLTIDSTVDAACTIRIESDYSMMTGFRIR